MEQGYVYVASSIFPALLAISETEQQRGLMGQEWPPPVMAFIYTTPRVNQFWMKGTPSPLDIIFCHQGKVSQIHAGVPFSTEVIGDNKLSDLIIELPYGTADQNKIKMGYSAGIVKPSPEELRKIIAEKYHLFIKY